MIASAEHAISASSCERSASAARCAVTSRAIVDAPTMPPATSRIAETVSETGTREPSRRTRSVTNCSMCSPSSTRRCSSACSSRRPGGTMHRHRLSDRLERREAVQLLARVVPVGDQVGQVHREHRVVRAAHDRRQALRIERCAPGCHGCRSLRCRDKRQRILVESHHMCATTRAFSPEKPDFSPWDGVRGVPMLRRMAPAVVLSARCVAHASPSSRTTRTPRSPGCARASRCRSCRPLARGS